FQHDASSLAAAANPGCRQVPRPQEATHALRIPLAILRRPGESSTTNALPLQGIRLQGTGHRRYTYGRWNSVAPRFRNGGLTQREERVQVMRRHPHASKNGKERVERAVARERQVATSTPVCLAGCAPRGDEPR